MKIKPDISLTAFVKDPKAVDYYDSAEYNVLFYENVGVKFI